MNESSNEQPNRPSLDWLDEPSVPLPEDSPIFGGLRIFSPSVPTNSAPPSAVPLDEEPEEQPATNDEP